MQFQFNINHFCVHFLLFSRVFGDKTLSTVLFSCSGRYFLINIVIFGFYVIELQIENKN